MSSALEWVSAIGGSSLLSLYGKGLFDRKFRNAEVKKTGAEESKIYAEAAKVFTAAAVELVAPLNLKIDELTKRVFALESENASTTGKLRRATAYIRELLRWIAVRVPDEAPPDFPDIDSFLA